MEPPPDEEDAPVEQKGERGPAGHVLSAVSTAAGTAANVTGNTINWVFGLPGKLLGQDDQDQPQQQQASQPRRLM
jgi:membrane protein YqaA with SNARE-associated domain